MVVVPVLEQAEETVEAGLCFGLVLSIRGRVDVWSEEGHCDCCAGMKGVGVGTLRGDDQ